MKYLSNPDQKLVPLFSYGYQKCMFIDFLNWIVKVSQLCSLRNVYYLLIFVNVDQILFKHVCLRCLLFDPHRATYQINYRGPTNKSSHLRPTYLNQT